MSARLWFVVGMVAVAACAKQGESPAGGGNAPAAQSSCTTDADCELVNGTPPNCCSRCDSSAVTKSEAARLHRECSKQKTGDYFDRCPHLSCSCVKETAVCKSGKCAVDSKDC